jgi:hypothetical protein
MKIIITESKLNKMVTDYLNEMYDIDNIGWTYGSDDWGNEVDYIIKFYTGDFDEDDNETTLFYWYGEDYWESEERTGWRDEDDDDTIKEKKLNSPILEFEDDDFYNTLNSYFGNMWKQPFIEWFWDKFHFPVKTIEK